jgi:hypothetical protein
MFVLVRGWMIVGNEDRFTSFFKNGGILSMARFFKKDYDDDI